MVANSGQYGKNEMIKIKIDQADIEVTRDLVNTSILFPMENPPRLPPLHRHYLKLNLCGGWGSRHLDFPLYNEVKKKNTYNLFMKT